MPRLRAPLLVLSLLATILAASPAPAAVAPGAPGVVGTWAWAGKTGVGTAYEPYRPGRAPRSRVWFSVADGMLTETMYGLIHQAQIRAAYLAVQTPGGLFVEGQGGAFRTDYLHTDDRGRPLSPAWRLITRDPGGYVEIDKRIFTDPSRNTLYMRVTVRPLRGPVTPYLLVEPHMGNSGAGDFGRAGRGGLVAFKGPDHLTVRPSRPFAAASVGFLGVSDPLGDLKAHGRLTRLYDSSGPRGGSIMLAAALSGPTRRPRTVDLAFGFGRTDAAAAAAADGALAEGYDRVLAHYDGEDGRVGWSTWLAGLDQLPRLAAQAADGGRLAYASALVLKVHEDKTHPGALIASLSNPWGEGVAAAAPSTGYKAVWPRDFYECAMALAALGDRDTPVAAFRFLTSVQVRADTPGNHGAVGWFQQKSHVDGAAEWTGVQLDQTAMPVMLGWKLWKLGLIGEAELKVRWAGMLRPAADFLVAGGTVDLGGARFAVRPPYGQQERWEEQEGYSPSTTAAVIAGLTAAADIARLAGDGAAAGRYLAAADADSAALERRLFIDHGPLGGAGYYLRVSRGESAAAAGDVVERNGQAPIAAAAMADAGFLELVRYGVRRADDPRILSSLAVVDDQTRSDDLRVRYDLRFAGDDGVYPGFRRYGHDGYGENAATGAGYGDAGRAASAQRGRVWPLLTGERGHYQLALAALAGPPSPQALDAVRATYVRGMEHFANAGLMLPEQVFDGVGAPLAHAPAPGQGTGSATPLAWAHAEYLKLLRSLADGQVWDDYPPVRARFAPAF